MSLIDSSTYRERIYSYLGFRGVTESPETDELIGRALKELGSCDSFTYRYKLVTPPPDFTRKEPYLSYLSGANSVIVSVATLGHDADRRIKLLSRTDAALSVVLDACASACVEKLADDFEAELPYKLSYRFCPGYGGSDISDLKYIFDILRPEKFGVTLSESGFMLPSKTLAGIIAVGTGARKSCDGCALGGRCRFTEAGKKCYSDEL